VVAKSSIATASQRYRTMHFPLTAPLFLSVLCASTLASPLAKRNGDSSKAHRQPVSDPSPRNGTKAMLRAYQKYHWEAPVRANENVDTTAGPAPANEKLATAGGSGSGSVTATPEVHNSEYLCPVTIGGQPLNLDVDTGSSDL